MFVTKIAIDFILVILFCFALLIYLFFSSHRKRRFKITAIEIPIIYNNYGDKDPNGKIYVLTEEKDKIKELAYKDPLKTNELIQPLVIRANVGDKIIVDFENELDRSASIHIQGVEYDVQTSDGAAVGFNKDTTTKSKIRYVWNASTEGTFLFHDMADTTGNEDSLNIRGLFGVLVVEKARSTWTDPVTGKRLKSGLYADIHHFKEKSFREFVTIFHDEPPVKDKDGNNPINPETGEQDATMAINYRAEPMRNRMGGMDMDMDMEETETPLFGEDTSMSSWPFGDPATPIFRTYIGDPVKLRLVHAGIKETHVFHMHNHQWRNEPENPNSTIIDSVTLGPQETMTLDLLFGAGSLTKTPGDIIWHCHLYPHFVEGMWGLLRIFDRLEEGNRIMPDGQITVPLVPLPDRETPLKTDVLHPGYPLFLKGTHGQRAEKPPLSITGSEFREPTETERANFIEPVEPGRLYSQPAPEDAPEKVFEITAIQMPLTYNNAGWHDPEGRLFVLKEDEEAVLSGKKKAEPLIIRANAGDKITIKLTNKLPETIGGNAFKRLTRTTEAGYHIHLVKFDAIVSDGSANGYNYDASAIQNETITESFYANEELQTVFFHDHLFANIHQQHGLFGALIVEPKHATFHDPKTGDEIRSGTSAVIRTAEGDFREFAMAVHDFTPLFDKEGNPLNPPPFPSSPMDQGVMGINYKSEPLQFREGDPAYVFSSHVHGDPVTPLFETYSGDPIRIRLFQGSHEEMHSFNINGLRWLKEPRNPDSPLVSQQTIGISEAFNFYITEDYEQGDHLYHFGNVDDIWLGLWGIIRAYGERVSELLPINGKELPEISIPQMEKTGNPPAKAVMPKYDMPKDAVVRKYEVSAIQKDIVYNDSGDHDPNGLMFVPKALEQDILSGRAEPEPLILRANEGEYVEVTLTNHLFRPILQDEHPSVPVDADFPPSNRVSMHASLVNYDIKHSDGATVGFNPDQTVAPGESITYLWKADKELGTCCITNFGDIRNHRKHGLFGTLIVEPKGSQYFSSIDGKRVMVPYSNNIIVVPPGKEAFREFVLFMHNGISMFDKDGNRIPDAVDVAHGGGMDDMDGESEENDYEDQGQKAFSYRSERYEHRLMHNSDVSLVMSSVIHGDPATPLFESYPGERVKIRLIMPGDKPRNHSFVLHGHLWEQQPDDALSNIISVQGAVTSGSVLDIELQNGANKHPGDYVYRSGAYRNDLEQGLWGIFRVLENEKKDVFPLKRTFH